MRLLSEEFIGKSETELEEEIGLDDMFEKNTDWLLAHCRYFVPYAPPDSDEFLKPGTHLKILEGGGGTVDMKTGNFTPEISDKNVRYLILSPLYQGRVAELKKYQDHPFLPSEVRVLTARYLEIADLNVDILGEVLNEASWELPNRCPTIAGDKFPKNWLNEKYQRRIVRLSPAAMDIINLIGEFANIDRK